MTDARSGLGLDQGKGRLTINSASVGKQKLTPPSPEMRQRPSPTIQHRPFGRSGLPAHSVCYRSWQHRGGGGSGPPVFRTIQVWPEDFSTSPRQAERAIIHIGRRRPMHFVLIIVVVAAAILFDIRPSGAYQGPWCAGTSRGAGSFVYNCSMRTLEQCVSEVIAGNRGFCNPNQYYRGPEAAPPRGKRNHTIIHHHSPPTPPST